MRINYEVRWYPISLRQRSSCSMRAGCAVGTKCLIANQRLEASGSAECARSEPRYTELNVPSPILRWTVKILSSRGSFDTSSAICCSGIQRRLRATSGQDYNLKHFREKLHNSRYKDQTTNRESYFQRHLSCNKTVPHFSSHGFHPNHFYESVELHFGFYP